MRDTLKALSLMLSRCFHSRGDLILENLARRQQLNEDQSFSPSGLQPTQAKPKNPVA
jgi:hypothetical protein